MLTKNGLVWAYLRWRGTDGDPKKTDNSLPGDKQYLITERVPCQRRIAEMESAASAIKEVLLDDGWVEARPPAEEDGGAEDMEQMMMQDVGGTGQAQGADEEEECVDMDEEVDMDAEMENPTQQPAATDNIFGTEEFKGGSSGDTAANSAVKRVRMYDLSITYDNFHRTPRLWLQGYSEDGDVLT